MKYSAVVVLVLGLVASALSASNGLNAALDKSVDEVVAAFEQGMAAAPALGDADSKEANEADTDSKSELAKALREALEDTINQIKDKIDDKHQKAKDLIVKANELVEKLKQIRANAGDKARDLVANYKEKVSNLFAKLIEKIRGEKREKRDVSEEVILSGLDLTSMLENVRAKLREKVNPEVISAYVRTLFGRFNPMAEEFIRTLHARGQAALQRVVDNLLQVLKGRERRAIRDVAQNVRDFLAGLGDHVRGRYADFAEWLGQVWNKGISQARDKHAQLREIAHEVIGHAKEMHKQTVREAVEALRPFREDLGNMWQELLDAARDALKRKE
jgi:uncharacterized coiled-coil DUF342 family protein